MVKKKTTDTTSSEEDYIARVEEPSKVKKTVKTAAIIVVIVAIFVSLWYFNIPTQEIEQPLHIKVCENLDKENDVFHTVIDGKNSIEAATGLRVFDIWGNESVPMMWNDVGVMCKIPTDLCRTDYVYCTRMDMIVPVNYTEWQQWYIE